MQANDNGFLVEGHPVNSEFGYLHEFELEINRVFQLAGDQMDAEYFEQNNYFLINIYILLGSNCCLLLGF